MEIVHGQSLTLQAAVLVCHFANKLIAQYPRLGLGLKISNNKFSNQQQHN